MKTIFKYVCKLSVCLSFSQSVPLSVVLLCVHWRHRSIPHIIAPCLLANLYWTHFKNKIKQIKYITTTMKPVQLVLSASKAPIRDQTNVRKWKAQSCQQGRKERPLLAEWWLITRPASGKTIILVLNYFCPIWPFAPPWHASPALCAYAAAPRPSDAVPQW